MDNRFEIRRWLVLLLGLSAVPAGAVTPVWHQEWTNLAPPTLAVGALYEASDPIPSTIGFSANGDLLLAGLTYFGDQSDVVRLSADGALRWAAKIPTDPYEDTPKMWPADDGGAFVSSYPFAWTVKLDADGAIAWTRRVPSQWFAALPGARIATATCKHLTALESQSGQVVWQRALPIPGPSSTCEMTGLSGTANEGLVFSITAYSIGSTRVSHTFKADSSGNLLWQFTHADETAHVIGVDSARIYVATAAALIALDAATGSALWQSAPLSGEALLVAGSSAIPVIVTADAVLGLAPGNGAVQWSQTLAVKDVASAVGGAVLVNTANGLVKLAADSGTIQWTTTLPSTDLFGHPIEKLLALGGLYQGQFMAVARVAALTSQPPPFVQRIDFLSGQLSTHVPMPSIPQGNGGNSILADGHIVSMSIEQGALAAQYRLSKVDADDGSEVWSRFDPPFEPALLNSRFGAGAALAAGGGIIAAAISEGFYPETNSAVSVWEMADGAPRWRKELTPAVEEWHNTIMSTPVITDDSGVLVSMSTYVACELPDICARAALYKFDGNDGSIRWQHSESLVVQLEPPHLWEPVFLPLEDDVALASGYSDSLLRLNGADGGVLWTADTRDLGSVDSLHLAIDGNLIAVGSSRWAKFDAGSGAMLWSALSPRATCFPAYCASPRTIRLPDGNLLQVGSKSHSGSQSTALAALLHTDGNGTYEIWFPEEDSLLRPQIRAAEVDPNGQIWMMIRERLTGTSLSLWSLTRFDLVTGEFEGRQAMMVYSDNVNTPYFFLSRWLGAPQNDRLPVFTGVSRLPAPVSDGIALLDTSVSSAGNLSLDASIPPGPLMPGESVPFQVNVHFSGTAALDKARVDIVLPWGSGPSGVSCSAASDTLCRIETQDGDLHAEFSIGPGESIVISGSVSVLDSAASVPRLDAMVHGPTGLLEQDTLDNFVSIPVVQSLFRDGFEPRPVIR